MASPGPQSPPSRTRKGYPMFTALPAPQQQEEGKFMPVLSIWNLKLREVKHLHQDHTASFQSLILQVQGECGMGQ